MIGNPDIAVYYPCFCAVSGASRSRPGLFYRYWQDIAPLLEHHNSYHRDIALTVLANLTRVDNKDLFLKVFDDYFEHLHDRKFMTAQCCVRNSAKIIANKPELRDAIIPLLLEVEKRSAYPEKQKALLNCDILEVLARFFECLNGRPEVSQFIKANVTSISPKTKARARAMVAEYGL